MKAARATTMVSIMGGGAIGALAAIYGAPPATPSSPRIASQPATFVPRSSAPVLPQVEPETPPIVSASASATPPTSNAPDAALDAGNAWREIPADLDKLEPSEAESLCGVRSVPRACLTAARAYDATDANKARTFRLLALSQFINRCTERDAESCYLLAELYDQGVTAPENTESPTLLRARARELCAEKATAFCEKLAAGRVK